MEKSNPLNPHPMFLNQVLYFVLANKLCIYRPHPSVRTLKKVVFSIMRSIIEVGGLGTVGQGNRTTDNFCISMFVGHHNRFHRAYV